MQDGMGSEDCLYLDVYAPAGPAKGIIFYVHGGCFVGDDISEYNGNDLVTAGDVIVVIPSWRTGVFGFLGAD